MCLIRKLVLSPSYDRLHHHRDTIAGEFHTYVTQHWRCNPPLGTVLLGSSNLYPFYHQASFHPRICHCIIDNENWLLCRKNQNWWGKSIWCWFLLVRLSLPSQYIVPITLHFSTRSSICRKTCLNNVHNDETRDFKLIKRNGSMFIKSLF